MDKDEFFKDIAGRVGITSGRGSMQFWDFDSLTIANGELTTVRMGKSKTIKLSEIDRDIRIGIRKPG